MNAATAVQVLAAGVKGLVGWLGQLLSGPFGGLIGGGISFVLLEMGYKRSRERHGVAEALAAELSGVAEQLDSFIRDEDPREIPGYFRTSHVVFDALANRLAELRFEDVASICNLYRQLDELNRMPAAWRERALNAYSMPIGHPDRDPELKAIEEGRKGFYSSLSTAREHCIGLGTYLRTKYTLGWRAWIPLRFRPARPVPPPGSGGSGV